MITRLNGLPESDIRIGLGIIQAIGPRTWIAPGGATTSDRKQAEGWARYIHERLVDERIDSESNAMHLSAQGYENFLAACNAGAKPNTALLRAARLHKDRKAAGEIK